MAVLGLLKDDSSSDLEERFCDDPARGYKSGALYASIFVV